jgi:hypothetical protein
MTTPRRRTAARLTVAVTALAVAAGLLMPLVGGWSLAPASAKLHAPADKYVRVAINYMRAGSDITPGVTADLAKFDLVVLPAEAQNFNPTLFAELRRLNPDITLLAYVPSKSFNFTWWTDELHQKLLAGIGGDWWLRDSGGNPVSVWPGTQVISSVSPWQTYLPDFVAREIMATGKWDGVFYDEFSASASWMNGGDIDLHRTGSRTDARLADVAWQRATVNLLRRTRELLGPGAVIVTNGDSTGELQPFTNGRMFEDFPTPWEAGGTWSGVMANYLRLHDQVASPPVMMVGALPTATDGAGDYRKMRYGLTSTLLGEGFFGFAASQSDYGRLWWYDEYDARLGEPLGGPINLLAPNDSTIRDGLWRRDFTGGVVLVNSTGQSRTASFGEELERLEGTQAPTVNNGAVATSATVPANDGLILIRRLAGITEAPFPNGAFVRLFSTDGRQLRGGFFAYDALAPGGASVHVSDVDGDGARETVVGAAGRVRVYGTAGRVLHEFAPFSEAYRGPINLAVADLDGDGRKEVVSGAGEGGGPHVVIHAYDGHPLHPGFFAFDQNNRGGVSVAVADVFGTGRPVIVTGAGAGLAPQVKIFTSFGYRLAGPFHAYERTFRGGVSVASADLDGDGRAEIVTGPGPGRAPHAKLFDGSWRNLGEFLVSDAAYRGGVHVVAGDLDGDGAATEIGTLTADILTGLAP